MSEIIPETLTGKQMTDFRSAALSGAVATHAGKSHFEILHTASAYLHFLLSGQPAEAIGGIVTGPVSLGEGAQQPAPEAAPKASPKAPKAAKATVSAISPAQPATPVPDAVSTLVSAASAHAGAITQAQAVGAAAAAATARVQPAATVAASNVVPPPTTIQAAAESLKACVQDKAEGRGREVAIAILAAYGVTQLSQIPAAQLAQFKADIDSAGKTVAPGTTVSDPTGGLLG